MEFNYFKGNLRYLRAKKGMTQSDLGLIFDLKKSQISSYEMGSSFPLIPLAIKIAKYFNITLSELFETDIQNSPEQPPPKNGKLYEATESPPSVGDGITDADLELEVEMDVGGVSMATESPPKDFTDEEKKKLKKLLEMIS
jgi:putative transcriptional regulator